MVGIIEDAFVNGLSADHAEWLVTGSSPYLQDSNGDYIRTFSDHKLHGHFSFPASTGSGTINSVKIRLECQVSTLPEVSYIEVFIYDGSSWTALGEIWFTQTGYKYYELDASAKLNTWAKINACQIEVKSHDTEAVTMYVRRGVRRVDYGEAVSVKKPLMDGFVLAE